MLLSFAGVALIASGEGEGLTQRQMGGVRFVPLISRLAFTEEL